MDASLIKSNASGQWGRIISSLCRVDERLFSGEHQPCPKCGGRDRFRSYDDFTQTGGVICNQCARDCSDGIATVQWLNGIDFKTSAQSIAEFLGIKSDKKAKRVKADPLEHLSWLTWNDSIVQWWCEQKQPISPEAVKACGGQLAMYRKQYSVIAFPVYGELLSAADPVGWVLYATSGDMLPKWDKNKKIEMVKCKLTSGSQPGFLINQTVLARRESWPKEVWKFEGVTDMLCAVTMSQRFPAFTNANGTDENPKHWWGDLCADRTVNVLHDADKPGQTGAMKAAKFFAKRSKFARLLQLPYEVMESHGRDFRDFVFESGINCYEKIKELIDTGKKIEAEKSDSDIAQSAEVVNEHPDDPHRLARINLVAYRNHTGGDLKFYREQWFKWKKNRYQKIEIQELKAKTRQTIKSEFDRIYFEKREDFTRRVTNQIVNNVVSAMESYCVVSGNVEMPVWMEGRKRESRNYIAMRNGLVDLEQLLAGDIDNCLYPHSPNWFSTFCLDYDFDLNAECPTWLKTLNKNLEGDRDRISILQEWAGYLISPRNDMQKFLAIEGEGANGKSVFLAVMEAMLGRENCSYVPLESFGGRFDLSSTIGKQANICADVGQIDSVCEGRLKSFTSGDPMTFDRKGVQPIEDSPTAKLMLAWNNRPRIGDSSSGPWRRMILVPFRVRIQEHEIVRGMDKAKWWHDTGELPGVFLWAINGLARLRANGRFTRSEICSQLVEDYKAESNPVLTFFEQCCEVPETLDEEMTELSDELYKSYRKWCTENGYHAFASNKFFMELNRKYKWLKRDRTSPSLGRKRCYRGIRLLRESELFNG